MNNSSSSQVSVEKELQRVQQKNSDRYLHLPHLFLTEAPGLIFTSAYSHVIRLDLSFNRITFIPSNIQVLTSLQELWVHHNPIETLPVEISLCRDMQVIDVSYTNVQHVPCEVSLLTKLHTLHWKHTPLSKALVANNNEEMKAFDLNDFKRMINTEYRRNKLKADLIEKLSTFHFTQDITRPDYTSAIETFVEDMSSALDTVDDLALFYRQCTRILPNHLHLLTQSTPQIMKAKLVEFQTDLTRRRLAAEVDIKVTTHALDLTDFVHFIYYYSCVVSTTTE
jgi:hypothetical protein